MPNQKNQSVSKTSLRIGASFLLALLITVGGYPGFAKVIAAASCSSTADCQSKINNASNTISSSQQQLSSLSGQANSYLGAINSLQAQISDLQAQISSNQAEQSNLNQQIIDAQARLDQQRAVLADTVRTMYIDGQMTTIEMLATSNNISDYIDKESYRQQVQASVQTTMGKIASLQSELNTKKQAVDTLLTNQQTQQNQLAYAKQQQSNLLAYNQSQQASYNQQIASSQSDISNLKARLAALNTTSDSTVSISGTCGGGYPSSAKNRNGSSWGCDYGQDNTTDNWLMLNRECVSYTAWMAYSKYGISTSGWGNAYNWIAKAQGKGYAVDQSPRAGDIAIRDRTGDPADVGHAMYVVSARSGSDITVWEYNQHEDGKFQERTFNPHSYTAPVYYIHFR